MFVLQQRRRNRLQKKGERAVSRATQIRSVSNATTEQRRTSQVRRRPLIGSDRDLPFGRAAPSDASTTIRLDVSRLPRKETTHRPAFGAVAAAEVGRAARAPRRQDP